MRMENAHLRLGRLEYQRNSGKQQTRIWLHVDRYIGEDRQAYLLSAFGNDAEVGAVTAAIHEDHELELISPDGSKITARFGKHVSCHKGLLKPSRYPRPVRHLLVSSQLLQSNGSTGKIILMNYGEETLDLAWSTLVSLLGLPADPRWAGYILAQLDIDDRIRRITGIGCEPVIIQATRADLLARIGKAIVDGLLPFPEKNGPVEWPSFSLEQLLRAA